MTRQEENWELMTTLQIPWHFAEQITKAADRKFLMEKVLEVQEAVARRQKLEMELETKAFQERVQAGNPNPAAKPDPDKHPVG